MFWDALYLFSVQLNACAFHLIVVRVLQSVSDYIIKLQSIIKSTFSLTLLNTLGFPYVLHRS
jgi:hypothetical protein